MAYEADKGMSYGDLEARASHVRYQLGMEPTVALPARQLFERLDELTLKVAGTEIPFTYAVEEQELEGRTYYDSRMQRIVVSVSEEAYRGLEVNNPRAIFTFAHELGHPVCHPRLLLRLPYIPHDKIALMRGSTTHEKFRDAEWQANGFAAALIAPAEGLLALDQEGRLRQEAIEQTFNMSRQSASYRLDNFRRFRQKMLAGATRGKK